MNWTHVVTQPLGLAGFALALAFGIAGRVVSRKSQSNSWILPTAYSLAALCVLGGLALSYRQQHDPDASVRSAPAANSMHIEKIEQKADHGTAVAGVQGDVTVNSPGGAAQSTVEKPKKK